MGSRHDQLTSIAFSASGKTALIWSNMKTFQNRMQRLGITPETMTIYRGTVTCEYRIPKKCIKITKPSSPDDEGSVEKRARAAHARAVKNQKHELFQICPQGD